VGLSAQQVPDRSWVAAQLGQHATGRVVLIEQAKEQVFGPDVPVAAPHRFQRRTILWNWVQAAPPIRRLCDLASAR